MVYIQFIQEPHALIFDGPSFYRNGNDQLLTSSNLEEVQGAWDLMPLANKEAELSNIRLNARRALQQLEKFVGAFQHEHRLLDFGSGYGFFLSVARELGLQTYGMEPLVASSAYARATFGLSIKTDTLHENTFPSDFFDIVTSFQVFEHLPYPKRSVENLARSMKKDGVLLIEVPRYDTFTMTLLRSRHRHFVQDHINFFSEKTLSRLLEQSGFQVLTHFAPDRIMSVRHLYTNWLESRLPKRIAGVGLRLLRKSNVWNQSIKLNVGDMLTIIARKT